MSHNQKFQPNWVSPPGETISDILLSKKVSESDFAMQIGYTSDKIIDLLQGRLEITASLALKLEQVLGGTADFWLNREQQYRSDQIRFEEKTWLAELPLKDMINFGWIKKNADKSKILQDCLAYFNVPNIHSWHIVYDHLQYKTAFKKTPTFSSKPAATITWLRQGEIQAEKINCSVWNKDLLEESLNLLRPLSLYKNTEDFMPELQNICAKSGIAVVVLPTPNGCRASGATRFITNQKALIQLSFRYRTDDHFWFTFFHEIGHLLLHSHNNFFLEEDHNTINDLPDNQINSVSNSDIEKEANNFAKNTLIPLEYRQTMLDLPLDAREVVKFAKSINISPGIVVGQLQKVGKFKYNQLNKLKRKYIW